MKSTTAEHGSRPPRRFRGLARVCLLGTRVPVAERSRVRLLGLAFLDRERAGSGLLLPRCRSIHTFGMRFPLDIVFLGEDDRVLRRERAVAPRRFVSCREASAVLELPSPPEQSVPHGGGSTGGGGVIEGVNPSEDRHENLPRRRGC